MVCAAISGLRMPLLNLRDRNSGDMIHLKIYGKHTIILSKHEDAVELLERRSVHYSDRVKSSYIDLYVA